MGFPYNRGRILRQSASVRDLVQETHLTPNDFIVPLFVVEGENIREEIPSMPNYFRYSLDLLKKEVKELYDMGLKSVLVFVKVPEDRKDNAGTEAVNPDGLMHQAVKAIKDTVPEMLVMTDVALDPYSNYGHDGIIKNNKIVNDETVEVLTKMALTHIEAGADFAAPSDMMDGRIFSIREAFEDKGYTDAGIMAYSAKYASTYYGPFRDALDSAPGFGDKKTYQMNPANAHEAVKEILMDIDEGADIVMVKPAINYLDVIRLAKDYSSVPVSAYHVSGEYSMIKAAAEKGWLDETPAMMEALTAIKRAGADLIATYFAKDAVKELNK